MTKESIKMGKPALTSSQRQLPRTQPCELPGCARKVKLVVFEKSSIPAMVLSALGRLLH